MFVDRAKISIKAGDGGNGAVAFHREKYVAAGGPDGGDGGKGGNIVFKVDDNLSTLLDFRYKRKYVAPSGAPGSGGHRSGKGAEDLVIRVPRGTVIYEAETGAVLADMSGDEPVIVAKGGKGGFGNSHFATPTRQIPRFAKVGLPGEKFDVILELKLIADVGFIGYPNVGKSTLLSSISAAKPKIANYHFTTLSPVLGVVYVGPERSFVAADIPGLIEGASEGVGLGHDFLRHIERCRMFVHVVDVSGIEGRDPIEDFEKINSELASFNEELINRPQIVAANKADIADEESVKRFEEYVRSKGYDFMVISAATRMNLDELVNKVSDKLMELPPVVTYEANYVKPAPPIGNNFTIEKDGDDFIIYAPWLEKILMQTDVDDYEALQYFQRALLDSGIVDQLREMGAKDNDTVVIGEYSFDYIS